VDLSFAESGISEDLAISVKTVETYRARLMQKLGIDNMPALMKFSIRAGITLAQP
jgi:two-component system, NarL family, response regulator NreC